LIPWNRFLGSLKVYKFGLCMKQKSMQQDPIPATYTGGGGVICRFFADCESNCIKFL
jgi:hypothetical protein